MIRIAKMVILVLFAVAVAPLAGAPQRAFSQENPGVPQQPSVEPNQLDENQLKNFARVYVQLEKITKSYEPRLKESPDAETSRQIRTEAKAKIDEALASGGLTTESYTQIVQTVNANDELRKKVIQMINEERKKPS
ncbi:MAG TPA: DUF4168 domain-containing protein [Candidatus Acidoferrales bacterium]|nr:DUF4168 domain-containing protein [Candidatus Acidoferrales bacterium]